LGRWSNKNAQGWNELKICNRGQNINQLGLKQSFSKIHRKDLLPQIYARFWQILIGETIFQKKIYGQM